MSGKEFVFHEECEICLERRPDVQIRKDILFPHQAVKCCLSCFTTMASDYGEFAIEGDVDDIDYDNYE